MSSFSANGQPRGITKPNKKIIINTTKSSDRRLATARQPAFFLHNNSLTNNLSSTIAQKSGDIIASRANIPKELASGKLKTVKRAGGGKTWQDNTLLEWDPKHFRLFVGNLGQDVTDDILFRAFAKFESLSKVKVVIDSKTTKNKGFGFVAFSDSEDYFKAFKEMNGKYIGQHICQLKRAQTDVKPSVIKGRRR